MEELKNCPVCNQTNFIPFIKCIDYTVTKETFNIVSCTNCGFLFTNPRPDKNEIGKYYDSEDYISHSNTNKGLINKIYHLVKTRAIQRKVRLVEGLKTKNKKLLDIGSGTGDFIGAMQQEGWQVVGIEPNDKAKALAIKNYKSNIYDEGGLSTLATNSFSIITMWHVLEHVHELNNRITEINNLLEPGGYAIIAVPNPTSWDAEHYKNLWAAYDVPRHLYHFSPAIIKTLFEKKNLKHIQSFPMKMDSFYVSMLSEKYKQSALGLAKAFFSGLYSNIQTKNDAEKYSSVIYVFQKN